MGAWNVVGHRADCGSLAHKALSHWKTVLRYAAQSFVQAVAEKRRESASLAEHLACFYLYNLMRAGLQNSQDNGHYPVSEYAYA